MQAWKAAWRSGALAFLVFAFSGCANRAETVINRSDDADAAVSIIVAVEDAPEAGPTAGSTARGRYAGVAGYAGSTRAAALAAEVAQTYGLQELAAWSIAPLQLRCMLYRLAAGADRADLLDRLNRDPRVRLAQPLNEFETFAKPAPPPAVTYDDPYVKLQRGFATINAGQAQRWSRGEGVRVALIDTGIDSSHADLVGRIAGARDFAVGASAVGERHGTQMAGVIAATANNKIGIVGVSPEVRLSAYRACWPAGPAAVGAARCNSFTLAQALGAAIADGNDIINLSLGGPADPLLQQLAERAIQRGAIIVGAVPPSGGLDGFPVCVPGVLAVASNESARSARRVLIAPGRDVLTLEPGSHYGYASGSSLAAAHVTGAVALLRSLRPRLSGDAALALLQSPGEKLDSGSIDVCRAMRQLQAGALCGGTD